MGKIWLLPIAAIFLATANYDLVHTRPTASPQALAATPGSEAMAAVRRGAAVHGPNRSAVLCEGHEAERWGSEGREAPQLLSAVLAASPW